jgi:pimeloyl-ACP methyl ester carboxylesterase
VPSETRLLETPSGQTFVRLSGNSMHPPLVLLPGSKGTSLTWIPNIVAFSARFRTYALDSIYDFGLSVSRQSIKKPDDLVTWLDEVLTVLVPEGSLSLVGLSYGGWLASQYSLRFPERVQKVVLLAPAMTVLPVSPSLILRSLLTVIPLPGFRKQFYYWLLHDTVESGETGRAFVDEAIVDWAVAEHCGLGSGRALFWTDAHGAIDGSGGQGVTGFQGSLFISGWGAWKNIFSSPGSQPLEPPRASDQDRDNSSGWP